MSDFEIRKATQADIALLVEFTLAMAKESEGCDLDVALLTQGVRSVFEASGRGIYWLIFDENQPIGSTLITSEWSDWYNKQYWWIQSLYCKPQFRGKGVVTALEKALCEAGQKEDVREIRLYVDENNQRAINAYKKSGFDASHYLVMTRSV